MPEGQTALREFEIQNPTAFPLITRVDRTKRETNLPNNDPRAVLPSWTTPS